MEREWQAKVRQERDSAIASSDGKWQARLRQELESLGSKKERELQEKLNAEIAQADAIWEERLLSLVIEKEV